MDQQATLQPGWNPARLLAFRFFFVYFIIYVAPFPFGFIPYLSLLMKPFFQLSGQATDALGPVLLGPLYHGTTTNTGSGDTSFNYVRLIIFAALALVITLLWSIFDRRRNHEKLLSGLNVVLRYYLAAQMVGYGFSKVFPLQFFFPSVDWLNQTYGESSPMRLLWTFMGYSRTYVIFSGIGEVLGGLLLLFRRTRLLGAFVVAIVMLQVVMLNLSYDVPVKLFSMHLLSMAVFLMLPDIHRLMNLFVLNQPVSAEPIESYFENPRLNLLGRVVKTGFILMLLVPAVINNWNQYQDMLRYMAKTSPATLFGEYEVETFILNSDTLPAREDDTRRWKGMMINARSIQVRSMDGVTIRWNCLSSDGQRKMVVVSKDGSTTGDFTSSIDGNTLTMDGILNDNKLRVIARRKSNNSFLLVDRGFHWINEAPFNQ